MTRIACELPRAGAFVQHDDRFSRPGTNGIDGDDVSTGGLAHRVELVQQKEFPTFHIRMVDRRSDAAGDTRKNHDSPPELSGVSCGVAFGRPF